MTENSRVNLIKKLEVTDLDGEKVMIDFASGKYFLLKGAANEIWDYIQNPIAVSDILHKLMSVYDVPEDTCKDSIFSFLTKLRDYEFITIE